MRVFLMSPDEEEAEVVVCATLDAAERLARRLADGFEPAHCSGGHDWQFTSDGAGKWLGQMVHSLDWSKEPEPAPQMIGGREVRYSFRPSEWRLRYLVEEVEVVE